MRTAHSVRDDLHMTVDFAELNRLAVPGLQALTELLVGGAADHAPASEDSRPFQVGWGMVAALHRQAAAVVVLHDQGLGHEAAPNRRLMVEYVAHLQWLVRDGDDAVDSMNKAHQHKHGGLRKAADDGGYRYDAEAADAVRDAVIPGNPSNTYNNTSNLLGRLGGGLLQSWLGETQLSHATLVAAGAFYRETDEHLELFLTPTYGIEGDPMEASPYIAFFFMFFGMVAFNELMVDKPWADELKAIGDAPGLAGAV
ncbi:hypothetical protein Sipo8835_35575 [Streptomyces ipomoeae]|uniref:Uncharacterized protein n=1 Tax=Streptomyces ipomoeae TaxID=103232 RepID=A0AAE9AWX5_9ACTN|nr:hypothetical protein [Streptomyces ipomoeae]TQE22717.1 hypothetical protein Sipo8835_35575 [Streptomyces ipomoeae]